MSTHSAFGRANGPVPVAYGNIITPDFPLQESAYSLWASQSVGGLLPASGRVLNHPDCRFREYGMVIEVAEPIAEVSRVVSVGSALPSGMRRLPVHIGDIPARSLLSRVTERIREPIVRRAPIGFEAEFVDANLYPIFYRAVVMPCSEDGFRIDTVLGFISYAFLERRRPQRGISDQARRKL